MKDNLKYIFIIVLNLNYKNAINLTKQSRVSTEILNTLKQIVRVIIRILEFEFIVLDTYTK